jgi:hypothetical protein
VVGKLIPEPQRTYVLELLTSLGQAADSFVLAGAQAMKFLLPRARATRDFDFVLDVLALRRASVPIATVLERLGYAAIPGAQNFQFQKAIPGSAEVMRIEFMAPSEHKRKNDFCVEVQDNVHAHACDGAKIVWSNQIHTSYPVHFQAAKLQGSDVRVVRSHPLVVLKCLAMDERYRNLRRPQHANHDRSEARTHADDIVAILSAQIDLQGSRNRFLSQFNVEPDLRPRAVQIIEDYFSDEARPGILLYEEHLRQHFAGQDRSERELQSELQRARRLLTSLIHS